MGQVLQKDRIGALSESSGTITLGSSVLTIGGQQYVTSALNVSATLAAANTRYQIYAVLNSGVVELVVSTNENSVGPVGYVAWKLVGSYLSASIGSFSSFISITGIPEMKNWAPIALTSPEGSWTTNVEYTVLAKIKGDTASLQYMVKTTGAPTATTLDVYMPTNFPMDESKIIDTLSAQGEVPFANSSAVENGVRKYTNSSIEYINSTTVRPSWDSGTSERNYYSNTSPFTFGANDKVWLFFTVPITGFPTKPIEDL